MSPRDLYLPGPPDDPAAACPGGALAERIPGCHSSFVVGCAPGGTVTPNHYEASILYPGDRAYPLDEKARVMPISQIGAIFDDWRRLGPPSLQQGGPLEQSSQLRRRAMSHTLTVCL